MQRIINQNQPQSIQEKIFQRTQTEPQARLVNSLRDLASKELGRGYPREALLEDFEHVRSELEAQDRNAIEDDVVTVMDALVGWCSPGAQL